MCTIAAGRLICLKLATNSGKLNLENTIALQIGLKVTPFKTVVASDNVPSVDREWSPFHQVILAPIDVKQTCR